MKRFELFEKFLNKCCEKYQNLDSVVFSVDILSGGGYGLEQRYNRLQGWVGGINKALWGVLADSERI